MATPRFLSITTLSVLLASCATVGPDYVEPRLETRGAFVNAADPLWSAEAVETAWWRQFRDPSLDTLMEQAMAANHDVRIAAARVRQARALLHESSWSPYPRGGLRAAYERRHASEVELPRALGGIEDLEIYDTGFDASWEIDVFGRARRGIEAARAGAGGAVALLRDARVSVIAEVARHYFALRGAQIRLAVATRNRDVQRETYELTEKLLEAGGATELDVLRARAQLRATEAAVPAIERDIEAAALRLAVLIGRNPGDVALPTRAGATEPVIETIAIGRPADLLRRRPDIRAAERVLAAETARIGVETAELFPRVDVTGFLGFVAGSAGSLGTGSTAAWFVRPAITWTVLDLGRIRARIAAGEARADAALAAYEQTVLRALEETESALLAYGKLQDRLRHLVEQAQAATDAARLARVLFEEGAADYLSVLDAERSRFSAESAVATAQTDLHLALVAVYKALGGGWEPHEGGANTDASSRTEQLTETSGAIAAALTAGSVPGGAGARP